MITSLISQAPGFLEETLADYPRHEPHMALFLTFLKISRILQDHMNTLTRRHLDFYYREVLQLGKQPEVPDKVHVVFELAQNFENHAVPLNTAFPAGTDSLGEDLIYQTDEELVVNRAKLDEVHGLKTLFLKKDRSEGATVREDGEELDVVNIYAAPVPKSLDGAGEEDLPADNPKWETLGSEQMPFGEIGFAIASPMLLLGEGERTVRLTLRFHQLEETIRQYGKSVVKSELRNNIRIQLTGEEGWVPISNVQVNIQTDAETGADLENGEENQAGDIEFTLGLTSEDPAIIPYVEDVHARGFATRFPVALFILDNNGLSTLGDIDLNLKAGIGDFEANVQYLRGEFAIHENIVYQAKGDIIGTVPPSGDEQEDLLWQDLTESLENPPAFEADPEPPYKPGSIVQLSGTKYRFNALGTDQIPNKENPVPIWSLDPLGTVSFDLEQGYNASDLVSYQGALYAANQGIAAIAPSVSASWAEPEAFSDDPSATFQKETIVRAGVGNDQYYILRAFEVQLVDPAAATNVAIWRTVEAYVNNPVNMYVASDVVRFGDQLYEATASSRGVEPTSTETGWEALPAYDNNVEYTVSPNTKVVHNGELYTPRRSTKGVAPLTSGDGWDEYPGYDLSGSTTYAVNVDSKHAHLGKLYTPARTSKNVEPDNDGANWTERAAYNTAGTVLYDSSANQRITHEGKLYEPVHNSRGVEPGTIGNGWEEYGVYIADQTYESSDEEVVHEGKLYDPQRRSKGVTPGTSGANWQEYAPYDTSGATTYTLAANPKVPHIDKWYEPARTSKAVIPGAADGANWTEHAAYNGSATSPYATNSKVTKDGRLFRANKSTNSDPTVAATPSDWDELSGTTSAWDESVSYGLNDDIKIGSGASTQFFFANVAHTGDDPSGATSAWNELTLPPTWQATEDYVKNDEVRTGSGAATQFFVALSPGIGDDPSGTTSAWNEVSGIQTWLVGTAYGLSDKAKTGAGATTRFFKAKFETLGDDPAGLSNAWSDISASVNPWLASNAYAVAEEAKTGSGVTTRYFSASAPSTGDDPTGFSKAWSDISDSIDLWVADQEYNANDEAKTGSLTTTRYFKAVATTTGDDPEGNNDPWEEISGTVAQYIGTKEYFAGDEAKVFGSPTEFFRATANVAGANPGSSNSLWNLVTATPQPWSSTTTYNPANLVAHSAGVFQASARSQGNDPSLGQLIWELLSDSNYAANGIEEYDAEKLYATNSHALYQDVIFKVVNASGIGFSELAPARNTNWTRKSTLDEYDPLTIYNKEDFVRFRGQIYQANAQIRDLSPSSEVMIWEEIDETAIAEYSDDTVYKLGSYVTFAEKVFRANAGIARVEPTPYNSNETWQKIPYYNPGISYPINREDPMPDMDLVWLGGSVYRCEGTVAAGSQIKPGDGNPWVIIDPASIAVFDEQANYQAGAIVLHNEFFYTAINAGKGIVPGASEKLWEEYIRISEFSGLEKFVPGEYVRFGRNLYRSQKTIVGDDPETSPALWKLVGVISEFNEGLYFNKQSHTLFNGKVYRAACNLQGIVPEGENAEAHWISVGQSYPYRYLDTPELANVDIVVEVSGIQQMLLENDDGIIDPGKPFLAFGGLPRIGSSLYIGSHEIFSKAPDFVDVKVQWGGVPLNPANKRMDFQEHYQEYDESLYTGFTAPSSVEVPAGNSHFEANFFLLMGSNWQSAASVNAPIRTGTLPLFVPVDPGASTEADTEQNFDIVYRVEFDPVYLKRDPDVPVFGQFRNGMPRGFMRMSLRKDFLHGDYPRMLGISAIDQDTDFIPNEPYTPVINSITLTYTASESLNFEAATKADFSNRVENFFHVYPYGQGEFFPVQQEPDDAVFASTRLVPLFKAPVFEADGSALLRSGTQVQRDANGTLYIGIRDLNPPENLHILFQVADGSENPARSKQRVIWSYMRHNRWIDFVDAEILSDATNNLLTSGIVKFAMPKSMTSDNTVLPAGLHWIRASVVDFADGVARAIDVRPQAVLASYRGSEANDPNHLRTALPSGSISELLESQAQLSLVEQPYASFGGRIAEQDDEYYVRVSERLRHKNRGVSLVDYELLVLEAFPDVYKAKCINHTVHADWQAESVDPFAEYRPGNVKLVVLPDLQNRNAVDRLKPRLSLNRMDEIRQYLNERISDFVSLEVTAPVFEEVQVEVEVVFQAGRDVGFYTRKLNEDLILFLSPWLSGEQEDIAFGGTISSASIINFIDEQEYVDFVKGFRLQQRIEGESGFCEVADDQAKTSTSASVLVSAEEHVIHIKTDDTCQTPTS